MAAEMFCPRTSTPIDPGNTRSADCPTAPSQYSTSTRQDRQSSPSIAATAQTIALLASRSHHHPTADGFHCPSISSGTASVQIQDAESPPDKDLHIANPRGPAERACPPAPFRPPQSAAH